MAPFLQQNVLGGKNVTGIYALEPMTHLQTAATGTYPDMVALETIAAVRHAESDHSVRWQSGLYRKQLSDPCLVFGRIHTGGSCARRRHPARLARVSISTTSRGDNEILLSGIIQADVPGFYVFSAPWETTSDLLTNINPLEGYQLTLPAGYQGPNYIYAISIPPSAPPGNASLVTYNSNLNPPSTYPVLPAAGGGQHRMHAPNTFQDPDHRKYSAAAPSGGFNTNETFYFIRHAEAHPTSTWEDGNYVGAGQWRALDLPNALRGKINPTQVYSIDPAIGFAAAVGSSNFSYVRPSLTVEPYAIANNLPFNLAASVAVFTQNAPRYPPWPAIISLSGASSPIKPYWRRGNTSTSRRPSTRCWPPILTAQPRPIGRTTTTTPSGR